MKLLLIYNKQAGGKRAGKILPEIQSYLAQNNIDAEFCFTEYKWHGIEIVKNKSLSAYHTVVACGGDGTVFEVVNGYYQNTGSHKPTLAIMPIGTGNAFARELNLRSFQWKEAIEIIQTGTIRKIDVAKISTEGKTYYSINMIGIGWPAEIGLTVAKWKFLGEAAYLLGVLYNILFLKNYKSCITIDDRKEERITTFMEIGNTVYTGSDFVISPGAVSNDGFLELIILNHLSRRRLIQILPKVFKGMHIHEKEVEIIKGKKIRIETETVQNLIPDGENLGKTPIEVTCLPQDLPVLYPNA